MNRQVKRLMISAAALMLVAAPAVQVEAWGSSGHRVIGVAAMRALPGDLPAFLRTAGAALLAVHFAALGWSAFAYGGGFFVSAFSAMFAGKALFFFAVGLIDVVTMWVWRRRHG